MLPRAPGGLSRSSAGAVDGGPLAPRCRPSSAGARNAANFLRERRHSQVGPDAQVPEATLRRLARSPSITHAAQADRNVGARSSAGSPKGPTRRSAGPIVGGVREGAGPRDKAPRAGRTTAEEGRIAGLLPKTLDRRARPDGSGLASRLGTEGSGRFYVAQLARDLLAVAGRLREGRWARAIDAAGGSSSNLRKERPASRFATLIALVSAKTPAGGSRNGV